jgi:hypothetical protein
MKIESDQIIIAVLREPREKILGILHEINAAGIFLRGIDLNYFDEWTSAITNNEPYLPMNDYFFPMWRVERISRDESSVDLPSMGERFSQKTGLNILDF